MEFGENPDGICEGEETDMKPDIAGWEKILPKLPEDRPAGILLRHAERPEFRVGEDGYDFRLTPGGVAASLRLGETIGNRIAGLVSSPVPRCVQTAAEVGRGAGHGGTVTENEILGHPSAFIADRELAMKTLVAMGLLGFVEAVGAGERLDGMNPPRPAAVQILRFMLETSEEKGTGLTLFASHDIVVGPFLSLLGRNGCQPPRSRIIGFLEGVAFWREGDGVRAVTRHGEGQLEMDENVR
jgi:hypothetical protein